MKGKVGHIWDIHEESWRCVSNVSIRFVESCVKWNWPARAMDWKCTSHVPQSCPGWDGSSSGGSTCADMKLKKVLPVKESWSLMLQRGPTQNHGWCLLILRPTLPLYRFLHADHSADWHLKMVKNHEQHEEWIKCETVCCKNEKGSTVHPHSRCWCPRDGHSTWPRSVTLHVLNASLSQSTFTWFHVFPVRLCVHVQIAT